MVARAVRKSSCFVIISMSVSSMCMGQTLDWASVGAMWYYTLTDTDGTIGYALFRVEKDTMFDSFNCKKIIIETSGLTIVWNYRYGIFEEFLPYADSLHPFALTRISNDSIYFFNWQCNRWEFVASNNFNFTDIVSISDNHPFYYDCNDILHPQLIGIDTLYWGNLTIRRFNFGDNTYLENIGWTKRGLKYFGPSIVHSSYGIVDTFGLRDLRCFYHPTYGLLHYDTLTPCDFGIVIGIISIDNEHNHLLYQYGNNLYFDFVASQFPIKIKIIDAMGNVVHDGEVNTSTLTLNDELKQGIYFILAYDKSNNVYRRKFVKFQ